MLNELKSMSGFILAAFMFIQPALAEICPLAQVQQQQLNAQASAMGQNKNTQFILAEVQNTNYSCGMYQRFYINKSDTNGDTAYILSRFLYFVFGDERVLSYEMDLGAIEQARAAYFWNLETSPRPVAVHAVDGVVTMAPPSTAEIASSPEYQALRGINPAAFHQIMQLKDSGNFDQLNAAAMQFLRQHWNVQSIPVQVDDCDGA